MAKPGDKRSLQDNSVFAIFEDSEQNLWIGTNRGLSLYNYNNQSFKTFQYIAGDSTSISNNIVRTITEDKNKILWIGTSQGLNSYDKKNGKFKHWQIKGSDNLNNNIQCLVFDKKAPG